MSKKRANRDRDRDRLFATTWVHVFEEDTPEGAVYRPEDGKIPLSRRPRARLALLADGTARVYVPGPDDRFIEQPAKWDQDGDTLVVRTTAPGAAARELVIVEHTPQRLVVRR